MTTLTQVGSLKQASIAWTRLVSLMHQHLSDAVRTIFRNWCSTKTHQQIVQYSVQSTKNTGLHLRSEKMSISPLKFHKSLFDCLLGLQTATVKTFGDVRSSAVRGKNKNSVLSVPLNTAAHSRKIHYFMSYCILTVTMNLLSIKSHDIQLFNITQIICCIKIMKAIINPSLTHDKHRVLQQQHLQHNSAVHKICRTHTRVATAESVLQWKVRPWWSKDNKNTEHWVGCNVLRNWRISS